MPTPPHFLGIVDCHCFLVRLVLNFTMVGTFASYCRECVDASVYLEVAGCSPVAQDEVEDDEVEMLPETKRGKYNKRAMFFERPHLIQRRRRAFSKHVPQKISFVKREQRCCVWCCQHKHPAGGEPHSRLGFKTTMCCGECDNVPLCVVPRYDGKTCFEMWHEATLLNEPCGAIVNSPEVRQHSNRKAPPSRVRINNVANNRTSYTGVSEDNTRRSKRRQTPNQVFHGT